jgi:hypothetical protein
MRGTGGGGIGGEGMRGGVEGDLSSGLTAGAGNSGSFSETPLPEGLGLDGSYETNCDPGRGSKGESFFGSMIYVDSL